MCLLIPLLFLKGEKKQVLRYRLEKILGGGCGDLRPCQVIFVITGGMASPARGRVHSHHALTWGTMCPFLTRPAGCIFSSQLWGKVMTLSLSKTFLHALKNVGQVTQLLWVRTFFTLTRNNSILLVLQYCTGKWRCSPPFRCAMTPQSSHTLAKEFSPSCNLAMDYINNTVFVLVVLQLSTLFCN